MKWGYRVSQAFLIAFTPGPSDSIYPKLFHSILLKSSFEFSIFQVTLGLGVYSQTSEVAFHSPTSSQKKGTQACFITAAVSWLCYLLNVLNNLDEELHNFSKPYFIKRIVVPLLTELVRHYVQYLACGRHPNKQWQLLWSPSPILLPSYTLPPISKDARWERGNQSWGVSHVYLTTSLNCSPIHTKVRIGKQEIQEVS